MSIALAVHLPHKRRHLTTVISNKQRHLVEVCGQKLYQSFINEIITQFPIVKFPCQTLKISKQKVNSNGTDSDGATNKTTNCYW